MKRARRRPREAAAYIGGLTPMRSKMFSAVSLGLGIYFGLKWLGVVK